MIQGSRIRSVLDQGKVRKEIVCLVVLPEENPFFDKHYIAIGELPDLQPQKPQKLTIMGYPDNRTYFSYYGKKNV